MSETSSADTTVSKRHPPGLARLFFTEMWERLAFYTMLNVLLLYATDSESGGLGLGAAEGNEIYGLYLAFVYFTPFPGGMIADRFIGYRKAVLIGGLTMSAGLFLMGTPGSSFFLAGLILLVVGNGFLKPNISVMVGNLYTPGDPKRDAGFNIFYMGINIGAFVASFLSSGVRNGFGWLWTFRVAGAGLLIGMVILVVSWKVLEAADRRPEKDADDIGFGVVALKILLPAFAAGVVGYLVANTWFPDIPVRPAVCGFMAGMVPVIVFFVRLGTRARASERSGLLALLPIYVAGGTFFMILHLNGSAMTQWARDDTARDLPAPAAFQQDALPSYYRNAAEELPRPHRATLLPVESEALARQFGQKRLDEPAVAAITAAFPDLEVLEIGAEAEAEGKAGSAGSSSREAERMRAASSAVYAAGVVEIEEGKDSHGAPTVTVSVPDDAKPLRSVTFVREAEGERFPAYVVHKSTFDQIYGEYEQRFGHPPQELPPGEWVKVINPELFQSLNAMFVVAFTPLIVLFFAAMVRRKRPISTARKLFYGLCLTTVSLLVMVVAGLLSAGNTSKVSGMFLVGFYAIVTIGELCLSPMGLSLVTKLTPKRLVGLAMGGWFLATAFGNNFSGFFGGIQSTMTPVSFFLVLAALAGSAALFIRLLLPRLDAAIKQSGG